jgi:tRNA A-37 threonylcarbamoyl transferase component Bud32
MSIRWIDLPEAIARQLNDLPALLAQGRAEIVKERPERTIYRVHVAGHDLHVKHCRTRGWRAWLRERLRLPKAQLEYTKLVAAARRQVPTTRPIGYGLGQSESLLVTPTVGGALPLAERLKQPVGAGVRITLAKALGKFIAHMHRAGILHVDLHPGNILIRGDSELFLLDLHDTRIGKPANELASIANLVLFNRWFILRATRADRLRFWRAYIAERMTILGERRRRNPQTPLPARARGGGPPPPRGPPPPHARQEVPDFFAARDVEQRTWDSNIRFWRRRAQRCLGENRRFKRIDDGSAVRDWPAEVTTRLLREDGGQVLKDSRTSMVAIRDLGDRRVICKHFRRSARACRRAWINGHAFLDCLLPTPRPIAMRGGQLITEFIPDAINLHDALPNSARKRGRIDRVARLIADLHQRGWSNRDLKAANILLAPSADGGESAWFIDLAGASRPIRLSRGRRAKDLARLNASFHDLPQLTRTDRLRFLRAYLRSNLHGRGDWKTWWKQIDARTRGKVAKNRRRGRPLA